MSDEERGTLKVGEPHPSSLNALTWIKSLPIEQLFQWQNAFSSCAISGNRLAEVCSETLSRLMEGRPISDRYLLGLAWSLRDLPTTSEKSDGPETVSGDVPVRRKQGPRGERVVKSTTKVGKKSGGPKGESKGRQKGKAVLKVSKA